MFFAVRSKGNVLNVKKEAAIPYRTKLTWMSLNYPFVHNGLLLLNFTDNSMNLYVALSNDRFSVHKVDLFFEAGYQLEWHSILQQLPLKSFIYPDYDICK